MTRQQQMEHLQRCCDDLNMLLERPVRMFEPWDHPPQSTAPDRTCVGHIHMEEWGSSDVAKRYRAMEITDTKEKSAPLFCADRLTYRECLRVLKAAIKALELDIDRRKDEHPDKGTWRKP